jgi:DnaJ-class molecular chaperone
MSDAADPKQTAAKRPRRGSSSDEGEQDEAESTPAESQEPRVCMPCHGSGKVISNLGGEASEVTCPWCRGGGERLTGLDAQEFHLQQAAHSPE